MAIENWREWAAWMKKNDSSVIVVLFISALVAGFASLVDLGVEPWDAVFYTLQMIVLNYDKPGGTTPGWLYHLSRLALPALASWALIKAYMTLAGRTIDEWMAKRASDHIVICGGGEQAKIIAASHLAQNGSSRKNIVLVTLNHHHPDLEKLQREGIKILDGDASDAEVLSRLNVHRAAIIYIIAGADETNLRILEAVKEARLSKQVSNDATCMVHVVDAYLVQQISETTRNWNDTARLTVLPFNSWKESARRVLVQGGPDLFLPQGATAAPQPHALIIGYSWFGQQLIEQLARLGHYASSEKLKVTLITPRETYSRFRLITRFPALEKPDNTQAWGETAKLLPVIDLQIIEAPTDGFAADKRIHNVLSSVSVAYICTDDAESGMATTNTLLLQTPQLQFPIFVSSTKGLTSIRRFVESGSPRVRMFDALEEGLQLEENEAYLRQYTEREAALVNLYFTKEHGQPGSLRPPLDQASVEDLAKSLRNDELGAVSSLLWLELEKYWRVLPEWSKESSRDTIRHLPIKQRAISTDFLVDELPVNEREILSRMEHMRWVAERLLSGWRHALASDREKKLHADLIAFDRLSEQTKRKDADIIEILRLLAKARSSAEFRDRGVALYPASITEKNAA